MRMLDLRIIFGAIVACISIIAIGVGLVLTNEALSVARSDRPDIRINAAPPQAMQPAIKLPHATPSAPATAERPAINPSQTAAHAPALVEQPTQPPAVQPSPVVTGATPPVEPAMQPRARRGAEDIAPPPPARHATRPAAPAPPIDPRAAGPLEPPPDVTGVVGRALAVDQIPPARPGSPAAARRSTEDDAIFPLFRLFVPLQ
jgi:hypothetical protein